MYYVFFDSENKSFFVGDIMDYNRKTDYIEATFSELEEAEEYLEELRNNEEE